MLPDKGWIMDARVPGIYEQIGNKIRELRTTAKGQTISQEVLAQAVNTTANTISRWETATYKPSISDLERLARFFGFPIPFSSRRHIPSPERTPSSVPQRT